MSETSREFMINEIYEKKNVDVKILHKRSGEKRSSYTLIRPSEPFFTPLLHILGPSSWDPVGQLGSRDQSYTNSLPVGEKITRETRSIDYCTRALWHIDRRGGNPLKMMQVYACGI